MANYQLHLRVTTVGSPGSGQPHAGGPGAGDVIVDQVIDLRQWVAERLAIDPVEPAAKPVPVPAAVVAPVAPKPVVPAPAPVTPVVVSTSAPMSATTAGTATTPVRVNVPDDDLGFRSGH